MPESEAVVNTQYREAGGTPSADTGEGGSELGLLVAALLPMWWRILLSAVVAAALGVGVSLFIPPTFTARTSFLIPQQQGSASAALAQIGALASLAGAGGGLKSPADQYVSLMESETIENRMIERFKLLDVYQLKLRMDARKELTKNVRVTPGKKDGIIVIEVDDHDAKRAADMANALVDELKQMSGRLALSEAQQRRVFFEQQMKSASEHLMAAQTALQNSGFDAGAIRAEPKATAEAYARTKAELAAAEVRVSALQQSLTANAPELQRQTAMIAVLKAQLAKFEQPGTGGDKQDYVGAYREFKYQEALFEIMSRQFELAKLDEAREGPLFQVVDAATPPERRSKPRRLYALLIGAAVGIALFVGVFAFRRKRQHVR